MQKLQTGRGILQKHQHKREYHRGENTGHSQAEAADSTAIGLALTEQNGGISALTTIAIVITGILGNLSGSAFCKLLRITDPIAQGVGFGTASHVIGTSRAMEVDPLSGAVSSLSLAVAGILTAVVFPFVFYFL